MLPERILTSPARVSISVDLPQPLGPMMVTISPSWTAMDTPCRMTVSPYPATRPPASSSAAKLGPGADGRLAPAQIGFDYLRVGLDGVGRAFA